MKELQLTSGQTTLVDDEDYTKLNVFSWRLHTKGYVVRTDNYVKRQELMHRQILNWPKGEVHHKDGNKLNNQKSNLELVTTSFNTQCRPVGSNNTSGYKGVTWDKRLNKWRATIKVNFKQKELGRFKTIEEAVFAYNNAAKQYFGDSAYVNQVSV